MSLKSQIDQNEKDELILELLKIVVKQDSVIDDLATQQAFNDASLDLKASSLDLSTQKNTQNLY